MLIAAEVGRIYEGRPRHVHLAHERIEIPPTSSGLEGSGGCREIGA